MEKKEALNLEYTEEKQPEAEEAEEKQAEPAEKESRKAKKEKAEKVKEEMQKKIDEALASIEKHKDQLLRTAAEYDNYRKRTEREKAGIYTDATAAAVVEFLPVADNLDRALAQQDCSAEDMRKGVEMVYTQLKKTMEKLGVTEMGAEGEPFDPESHNAVSHIEEEALGENVVAQVYQKGYKIGDKVVRHATVVVAN